MIQKATKAYLYKTLNSILQKCKSLNQLKQVHAHLIISNLSQNPFAIGPLFHVATISKNPSFFSYSVSIFNHFTHKNTYMYNTMIRAYVLSNSPKKAISCYLDMLNSGTFVNNYTFPPLIKACCSDMSLISNDVDSKLVGESVHAHVLKFGFCDDPFVISALIEFYSLVREINNAKKLFDASPEKDVVMWTALIDGCGRTGDVEEARSLFDKMPKKNVISWSAIIAAYSRVSDFKEVLSLFREMQHTVLEPNESVLVSVVTACAHLGAVTQGLWAHWYAKKLGFQSNTILATSLVDMYSKFGLVNRALLVFEGMSNKDVGAWNAMITGVALNGDAKKSLELFNEMVLQGMQPSETTFVALLTACTHARMINTGLKLFHDMDAVYGVAPRLEHFACVVDLLARSGMVDEAERFIEENMGGLAQVDANVWGALLGACRIHGNVEHGNRIWKKLVDMGITDCGSHVLSYNIYREAGWETEAKQVRKMIMDSKLRKPPGCSVIEVEGIVEEFNAGDFSHPQVEEICSLLDSFLRIVKTDTLFLN